MKDTKNTYNINQIRYKNYVIKSVEYPEFIEEIGKLRVDVWKNVEGMNPDLMAKGIWIDASDKNAMHWVIFKEDKLVGSARMTVHETIESIPYSDLIMNSPIDHLEFPVSSLNRLVIHPDHTKRNLAHLIDEIRIKTASEMGIKSIIGEPVSWRIKQLEKLGFKNIGPIGYPKEAPGLLLTLMIKKI